MTGRTTPCSKGCRHPECVALRAKLATPIARDFRQTKVAAWVTTTFGSNPDAVAPQERAARLLEEALELAQVEGLPRLEIRRLTDHVYGKPVGTRAQELGGVGVTLLAYAATVGLSADDEEAREFARVLALPPEHFWKRQNAKADAGVAVRVREEPETCGQCGAEVMGYHACEGVPE